MFGFIIRPLTRDLCRTPWDFTFGMSPTVAFVADRPTATACGRNWMLCAFAGCLRTPVVGGRNAAGDGRKKGGTFSLQAFGCTISTHKTIACCLSLSLLAYLQAELAGKTLRSMPWKVKRPTGRFVFAFFHGPKCWAFRWKKRWHIAKDTLGQPHGTMPKPLIRLLRSFGRRALYGRRRSPYGRPGTRGAEGGWKRTLDPRRNFLVTKKTICGWIGCLGLVVYYYYSSKTGGLFFFFWG